MDCAGSSGIFMLCHYKRELLNKLIVIIGCAGTKSTNKQIQYCRHQIHSHFLGTDEKKKNAAYKIQSHPLFPPPAPNGMKSTTKSRGRERQRDRGSYSKAAEDLWVNAEKRTKFLPCSHRFGECAFLPTFLRSVYRWCLFSVWAGVKVVGDRAAGQRRLGSGPSGSTPRHAAVHLVADE